MRFCIIDISNLVHRAKHSVGRSAAKNPYDPFGEAIVDSKDDQRVGLILTTVFAGMIAAYQKFDADHVVATFDTRSWRRDFYEDYKANRRNKVRTPEEEADKELIEHVIDEVRDFLKKYTNVTVLEADKAEADDFVARWVQVHDDPAFEHVIVSADGDFKQLVRDGVELYNPMANILYCMDGIFHQDTRKKKKNEPVVKLHGQTWRQKVDRDGEPESFDPEWELFEKCIRGDTSDNIKSAFPRVHTTKMRKAFNGSVEEYNNFINSTWGVAPRQEGDPEEMVRKNSVKELFERNKTLIDLTAQPDDILIVLDEAIIDALEVERARMVGAYFSSFCSKYKLPKLMKSAERYTEMLSQGYPA